MNKYVNGVLVEMTDAEIAKFNAEQHTETELKNEKWASIRSKRDQLLSESDWVASKASETGVAVSDEWKTYRQALRDVPTQSDPDNITWPTKPS
tara:strand:+ start:7027 stop:7308 length:282 start_codon:yes stop_codon:yes gene_type:complete